MLTSENGANAWWERPALASSRSSQVEEKDKGLQGPVVENAEQLAARTASVSIPTPISVGFPCLLARDSGTRCLRSGPQPADQGTVQPGSQCRRSICGERTSPWPDAEVCGKYAELR
jgi:hypothetical protein